MPASPTGRTRHRRQLAPLAYSPADVMVLLGLGRTTVYALIESGALRGVRVGRSWLIDADSVEELLRKGAP